MKQLMILFSLLFFMASCGQKSASSPVSLKIFQGYAAVWWNGVTATVLLSISALLNYAIYRENSEFGSFDGSINLVVLLWFVFLLGVWLRQRN